MKTIVTSMSKDYYDLCGEKWVDTFSKYIPDSELYIYSEDAGSIHNPKAGIRDLHEVRGYDDYFAYAKKIEATLPEDKKTNYRWQASRFCHKPFAIWDLAQDVDELYWFDADVECFAQPADALWERIQAPYYGVSLLQRPTFAHTEGGFIGLCRSSLLLDTWYGLFVSKQVFKLAEWHDCMALDVCVGALDVPVNNLTRSNSKHPWPDTLLGTFSRHNKGPGRKTETYGDATKATKGVVLSSDDKLGMDVPIL